LGLAFFFQKSNPILMKPFCRINKPTWPPCPGCRGHLRVTLPFARIFSGQGPVADPDHPVIGQEGLVVKKRKLERLAVGDFDVWMKRESENVGE